MAGWEVHVQTPPQPPYKQLRDCWRALDDEGFDAIWSWDHFFTEWTPGDYEGWTLLAALAEATQRARIGVFVTAITFRHPSLLAKIVTTVDHVSDGRLITGLGTGRLEPEHVAFGVRWPAPGERVRMLREAFDVLDGLSTGEAFSYEGRTVTLREAKGIPAPVQRPRPPILIGGRGPKMLQLTAERAEYWNVFCTPEQMRELNDTMDELCRKAGREPSAVKRLPALSARDVEPGVAERYREAGADGIIFVAGSNDPSTIVPLRKSLEVT